jgi:hypothetical protein
MRFRTAIVSLTLLVLAACAGSDPEASGAIAGRVTVSPTCPVETEASPCPPAPWRGTVRATAGDGSTYETESDATGGYRLALPPGDYVVVAVTDGTGPPTAIPAEVTVTAGPPRDLDLQVDSGIR